jgi:hypothetical protein
LPAPDGFGKSRILAEIARVARSRNVIVLTAEGGALGTWGGVGALARQLVQLLGRGARMCVQHEETLRHLLGESDAPASGSAVAAGRDPLIPLCTAAVTDLVRIAFRETPGLLVLDDEENLSPAARQVWRSTGEFVQTINGGGGVLRALLVSASTCARSPEVGTNRITIQIEAWRQRDVEKYLARAFAAPGGARDASDAIFPITGGCPSDVVGYLRELERRGLLRREGLRWRLAAPLSALPPLSGGVSEQVRRAMSSCSRDAVALVECLAVARDVRLSRTSVGELCDVRGPRLAAAADAAVAAGLLVAVGAAWRVRTDAAAHKVCAAIPDERRRVLHREILNVLLETTPDAIDALAVHARASRDPRADAWTRDAIARARAEGEWGRALSHLDDAAALGGSEFSGLEAELARVELLTSLGRVGEVIEALRQRRADEYPSLEVGLKSLLLLTRAYYEAREWQAVLDLAMPDTSEAPPVVAELRYIRAAAMRHMSRIKMAEREARLAAAEGTGGTETYPVALARYEYEYQSALYAFEWPGARTALVAKLRLGRRARDKRQVIVDLAKLGNAARYVVKNLALSHAILVRAVGVCRAPGEVGGATKSLLHGALAHTCLYQGVRRRGFRHLGKSSFYAVQSGAASLIVAARLRLIYGAVVSGAATYEDKRYVQTIVANRDASPDTTILSARVELGMCLLYYGYQTELERLIERLDPLDCGNARNKVLPGFGYIGRMWLDECVVELPGLSSDAMSARRVAVALRACGIGDLWIGGLGYCAMQSESPRDPWLDGFLNRRCWIQPVQDTGLPGWGTAAFALALALWIPIDHDAGDWDLLLSVVRKHKGPLPVALEWQRVLMESRELRRQGEWHRSEAMRECAEAQLDLLLGEEFGERGARAHARWKSRLHGRNGVPMPAAATESGSSVVSPGAAPTNALPAADDAPLVPGSWRTLIQSIVDASSGGALVITSPHLRELQLFSSTLHDRTGGRDVVWTESSSASAMKFDSRYPLVLVAPNLWPSERLRSAHEALANRESSPARVVSLLTIPLNVFRTDGPYQRSLSERMDGRLEQLEQLCSDVARRGRTFQSVVARASETLVVDDAVVAEIVRYDWPGGLAEVERLAQALAARGKSPITVEILNDTGWRMRVDARDDGLLEEERQLLREVSACSCAGIAQLSAAIGRPRRTVLRYLNRLVGSGSLVRTGRGRATLYRTRSAAFPRRA